MSHLDLQCGHCLKNYAADISTLMCEDCNGPLDLRYSQQTHGDLSLGRWSGFAINLPPHSPIGSWSLGEGNTPTVDIPVVGKEFGLNKLFAKLDYLNPTGSFKDRGVAVMIAVAKEQGVVEVVEDSSGNAGASVSAYAARNGMLAHIFTPSSAPQAKLSQIRSYGATVHVIDGSREKTTESATSFCDEKAFVYTSHAWSPYFLDGIKTFAYEVVSQFNGNVPDHVVFPVGNGGLLLGAWRGFRELYSERHISRIPKLHAVQPEKAKPIVANYAGEKWNESFVRDTVAGGISVAVPVRGTQVLAALRETGGIAVSVTDAEIVRMQAFLATGEGIFAEPTSAAALAGLPRLKDEKVINHRDVILIPVTGSGLKS